jgi:hypothetical protein
MKTNMFQQVKLEKKSDNGVYVDTIFIPQDYAVKDSYIERKINGTWNNGWKVVEVYEGLKSQEQVTADRDLYKSHRKGTDI